MKRLLMLIFLGVYLCQGIGQVPQKFSYQAAIRNTDGSAIANEDVDIKILLRKTAIDGEIVYSENHLLTTNPQGVVSLSVGGGILLSGSFTDILWHEQIFIQVDFRLAGEKGEYTTLGVSQILSVPYALYAGNAIQGEGAEGYIATHDGVNWTGTNQINVSTNSVEVKAQDGRDQEEPIFVVRNSNQEIVFAVYETGARVNISEDSKSNKGGFAVGGLTGLKETTEPEPDFLTILPDSVRFNIVEITDPIKGNKGGFAVGGLTGLKKEATRDYFTLKSDSVRFIIEDIPNTGEKGNKGGFAIGGLTGAKGEFVDFLSINKDSVSIYTALNATGDVNISGNLYTGGTVSTPPINDVDGHTYHTLKIGNQTWMTENLKTAFYNDLENPISMDDAYFYNNDPMNADSYGVLYSWFAVHEGAQEICPTGWHLPSQSDWEELLMFVGGVNFMENTALTGSRLMENSPLWLGPIVTPTNQSGFSGRPGGYGFFSVAFTNWEFLELGLAGYWWAQGYGGVPMAYGLTGQEGLTILGDISEEVVYSVRCIKDNW